MRERRLDISGTSNRSLGSRLAEFWAIALGYGLLCTAFERVALPLVFTSVLWLPAGIAFAIVYVRGYRAAIPLFIGAILGLLTRVVTPTGETAPGVTPTETAIGVLLEAIIVVGHSVLGTWLVSRVVRDRSLTNTRDAVTFLVMVGPVACMVGALLGPPAMLIRDIVERGGELSVSFNWLVGDGLGVLLVAPVAAALAGPHASWRSRTKAIVAGMSAVTIVALAIHMLVIRIEADRAEEIFRGRVDGYVDHAEAELARAQSLRDDVVQAMDDGASRAGFEAAASRVRDETLGARSVTWISDTGVALTVPAGAVEPRISEATLDRVRGDREAVEAVEPRTLQLISPGSSGDLVVTIDPVAALEEASDGQLLRDAGVALALATAVDQSPGRYVGINRETRRFLVDGRPRPEAVLRPSRAPFVIQDRLIVGDSSVPLAMAPTVSYLRSEASLYAAIPVSLASMLLAFGAGVLLLVLSGRAHRLERLVQLRTEDLARSEHRYRSVVDNVAMGIVRTTPEGNIEFVNDEWARLLPTGAKEPLGLLLESALPAMDPVPITEARERAVAAPGSAIDVEFPVSDGDKVRWFQARIRYDQADASIAGTVLDVTARRELEQAQEEFISLVSHEFRTPVTVISGSVSTIEDREREQLPPIARAMLPVMHASARRLLRLVDDLLLAARAGSGTMSFRRDVFELEPVVVASAERAAADAELAGLIFEWHVLDEPVYLEGDPDRIGQLLDNLLSNAIKYSGPRGRVSLVMEQVSGGVVLSVADEGMGISEPDQEHLFERFWRSSSGTRHTSGTGLGLAICKEIVDAHGGSLTVESTLGVGSTFRVQLPVAPAAGGDRLARLNEYGAPIR